MKNIVYNSDCLEAIKEMPDNAFELAIIDPPYGIKQDGSKNHTRGLLAKAKDYKGYVGGDKDSPSLEYFEQLFRISENQIIFGANHFIEKINKNSSCWIVWDKCNGGTDFADCELAWTSFSSSVRIFRYMWNGMMQGQSITKGHLSQGNKKLNEKRIHGNQKPVNLYKWLLMNYAKVGDKIFDSHCGSGSIRIACHELGFDFTGYELDEKCYLDQEERYNNYILQGNMFIEQEKRVEVLSPTLFD